MSSNTRLWTLLLVITTFLSGLAAGLLLAPRVLGPAEPPGPFAAYQAELVRAFDLRPKEARGLRAVLDNYHREIEQLKSRQLEPVQDELARLGLECRDRIRTHVLPPNRRGDFDLMSRAPEPQSPALIPR